MFNLIRFPMKHYKLQEITAVALLAAGVAFALMGLLLPPDGHDSRQRPLGLRPVSDLCRQRAGRHRLFEIE